MQRPGGRTSQAPAWGEVHFEKRAALMAGMPRFEAQPCAAYAWTLDRVMFEWSLSALVGGSVLEAIKLRVNYSIQDVGFHMDVLTIRNPAGVVIMEIPFGGGTVSPGGGGGGGTGLRTLDGPLPWGTYGVVIRAWIGTSHDVHFLADAKFIVP